MKVHHAASGRGFYLTPLLDRGWGYDPYVRNLIGRIKAGRPALECLFDNNSLFLGSGRDADISRPTRLHAREFTAAELAEWRADQDKRKAAWEAVEREAYEKRKADKLAQKAERQRNEAEWEERTAEYRRQAKDQAREWRDAQPPVEKRRTIPNPGWWRQQGDDVVVAVLLHAHNPRDVLVGHPGAALWISKAQIKYVQNWSNGLHELTLDAEFAKRAGFCNGKPTAWVS